ncbi:MAG TPA: NUDIX hydrolase [Cryomorphaceae bacterium]|nr:NUDIX hydrolase [Owenweeksia sp.]MBG00007.1 NUDIX hydrolase [Owenweeksia sp.]HAD97824.1 NUDIX hydrolase [Cryomorphaceae bacterium]HBF18767.1 NUDIX hydrolase [Cryomorphaceae bacterium]HCQ15073.1 NUDIX hydrolase [Cryomorphaceae bacterium]|tara:strand:- start:789 stop:1238 length:450 start_codon:yes stop_codon:yes gene_type:complete
MSHPVTIRVYGLLIQNRQILLSRENIKGHIHTKFPGGGLEPKEGVIDCLKREFMEEVHIELSRAEHFYTTEDYFASAFHPDQRQVLSLYYRVWTDQLQNIITHNPDDPSKLSQDDDQVLYWAPLDQLEREPVELPIDKIVVAKLLAEFN